MSYTKKVQSRLIRKNMPMVTFLQNDITVVFLDFKTVKYPMSCAKSAFSVI